MKLLNLKRRLVQIRSTTPALLVLLPFVFGQFLAEVGLRLEHEYSLILLVASTLLLLLRKGRQWGWQLLIVGVCASNLAYAPLLPSSKQILQSTILKIDSEPRRRSPGEVEFSARVLDLGRNSSKPEVDLSGLRVLCRAVELPWKNANRLQSGQEYVVLAGFRSLRASHNPFNYNSMLRRHGYSATCRAKYFSPSLKDPSSWFVLGRRAIEEQVLSTSASVRASSVLLSMALGTRDLVGRRIEDAYKRTGLAHLLVFSGCQVMLVYYLILFALRSVIGFSSRIHAYLISLTSSYGSLEAVYAAIATFFALLLVILVGIDGSSLRAAAAIVILAIVRLLERGGGGINSVVVSLLIISCVWPGAIFEPGIQLTYAALFGILLGSSAERKRPGLRVYLVTTFAIWLCTTPVVVLWFEFLSWIALPINALFTPMVSFISCNIGLPAVFLHVIGIDPAGYLVHACAWLLELFTELILWTAHFELIVIELSAYGKLALLILLWPLAKLIRKRGRPNIEV